MHPRHLALVAIPLALVSMTLTACHMPITGRPDIPPQVPEKFLHFHDASVARGDMAPDFELTNLDGTRKVRLSEFRGRPTVLVFGSHTCNVFGRDTPKVRALWNETHERANFLLVYVREAHPNDEWEMRDNHERGLSIPQPTTEEERLMAARFCVADFKFEMPTVVDSMDDAQLETWGGWPDRLYVIDAEGRIAYQGGVGPFGFKPDEVRAFLRETWGM